MAIACAVLMFVVMGFCLRAAMRAWTPGLSPEDAPMTIVFLAQPRSIQVKPLAAPLPAHPVRTHATPRLLTARPVRLHAVPPDALRAVDVTTPEPPTEPPAAMTFAPPPPAAGTPPRDLLAHSHRVSLPGSLGSPRIALTFHDDTVGQRVIKTVAMFTGGTGVPYDPCPDIRHEMANTLDDPDRARMAEERFEHSCEGR